MVPHSKEKSRRHERGYNSMNNSLKIAQLSDLHFCQKYLAEVERCCNFAVNYIKQTGVDVVVISGDATECGLDMHAPAADAVLSMVRCLADCAPVLMLQGTYSHEPPGTLNLFRHVGGRYPVFVADSICQVALRRDAVSAAWVQSDDWCFRHAEHSGAMAIFSCLPSVNKGVVAAAVGAEKAAYAVGASVAAVLAGFSSGNEAARRLGIPTIGVSHGTVNGCVTEHGVPMAGMDHEFTVGSLFAAGCSAFCLGHRHRHQIWRDGDRAIAYPGSIARLHYGEAGDKGFLIWNVTPDGASMELKVTPTRKMVSIEFSGKPDLVKLADQVKDFAGAFVRVRWVVMEEHRQEVDRQAIQVILAEAAQIKLEERVVPLQRPRLAGIGDAESLREKVRLWADQQQIPAAGLLARLDSLSHQPWEQICDVFVSSLALVERTDK